MRPLTPRTILPALGVLLSGALYVYGQTNSPTKTLSAPVRRVAFDREAFFGEGQAMPHWSNGYLVARRVETFQPGIPNVRIYDQDGHRVREAAIWFAESQRVIIYSVAVTAKGEIVTGGSTHKADGTTVPFISLSDASGNLVSVLQTIGFGPKNICLAPDGTVWSFGGTGYDEASQPNPGDMLRHFDLQKGQLGTYLPRSTFSSKLSSGPEIRAQIDCSGDAITIYSSTAGAYIEMKYTDASPRVYDVAPPPELKLIGFAICGPEQVYGSFSRSDFGGLYYLTFDLAGKPVRWSPVQGTVGRLTDPGVISGLWGAEGNRLLVSREDDSIGVQAVHWTQVIGH